MTTQGYGDIVAVTGLETVVAVVSILVGSILFPGGAFHKQSHCWFQAVCAAVVATISYLTGDVEGEEAAFEVMVARGIASMHSSRRQVVSEQLDAYLRYCNLPEDVRSTIKQARELHWDFYQVGVEPCLCTSDRVLCAGVGHHVCCIRAPVSVAVEAGVVLLY